MALHLTALHCTALYHTAPGCTILQHYLPHFNVLHHTGPPWHGNTLSRTLFWYANTFVWSWHTSFSAQHTEPTCNTPRSSYTTHSFSAQHCAALPRPSNLEHLVTCKSPLILVSCGIASGLYFCIVLWPYTAIQYHTLLISSAFLFAIRLLNCVCCHCVRYRHAFFVVRNRLGQLHHTTSRFSSRAHYPLHFAMRIVSNQHDTAFDIDTRLLLQTHSSTHLLSNT